MDETALPTNRLAILSLVLAALTVLSFCVGAAPIPLTGWVCFPAAVLLGAAALGCGLVALRRIRSSGERGRGMALTGVWLGGLGILATLCMVTLTISVVAALIHQLLIQAKP
jgi:hypothetical protein